MTSLLPEIVLLDLCKLWNRKSFAGVKNILKVVEACSNHAAGQCSYSARLIICILNS